MLIDCGRCAIRGTACAGCMVSALFEAPAGITDLTTDELRAIEMFDAAGLDAELLSAPEPIRLRPRRRHVA
jgi:hypothetical protein